MIWKSVPKYQLRSGNQAALVSYGSSDLTWFCNIMNLIVLLRGESGKSDNLLHHFGQWLIMYLICFHLWRDIKLFIIFV